MLVSVEGTVKKSAAAISGEYEGCYSVVTLFFSQKSLTQNRPVCWSIVVKEKPTVGLPFFGGEGGLLSDHIPKAAKDISVRFFMPSFNFRYEVSVDCQSKKKPLQIIQTVSGNFLKLLRIIKYLTLTVLLLRGCKVLTEPLYVHRSIKYQHILMVIYYIYIFLNYKFLCGPG